MELLCRVIKWAALAIVMATAWVTMQNENPGKIKALEVKVSVLENQFAGQQATLQQMNSKLDLLLSRAINK